MTTNRIAACLGFPLTIVDQVAGTTRTVHTPLSRDHLFNRLMESDLFENWEDPEPGGVEAVFQLGRESAVLRIWSLHPAADRSQAIREADALIDALLDWGAYS